jgi:hypothetical protein
LISSKNQSETDSYFDTNRFRFHGPDRFEADYRGLANYFESIRASFDDLSIRRGIIAEGNYIACQTFIEGRFVRAQGRDPKEATVKILEYKDMEPFFIQGECNEP